MLNPRINNCIKFLEIKVIAKKSQLKLLIHLNTAKKGRKLNLMKSDKELHQQVKNIGFDGRLKMNKKQLILALRTN
jgi:hypothetical protein